MGACDSQVQSQRATLGFRDPDQRINAGSSECHRSSSASVRVRLHFSPRSPCTSQVLGLWQFTLMTTRLVDHNCLFEKFHITLYIIARPQELMYSDLNAQALYHLQQEDSLQHLCPLWCRCWSGARPQPWPFPILQASGIVEVQPRLRQETGRRKTSLQSHLRISPTVEKLQYLLYHVWC